MTRTLKVYWFLISSILISEAILGGLYLYWPATKWNLYTGFVGVYSIQLTLIHVLLLFVALIVLLVHSVKNRDHRFANMAHLAASIALIIAIYLCADWVLGYSIRTN